MAPMGFSICCVLVPLLATGHRHIFASSSASNLTAAAEVEQAAATVVTSGTAVASSLYSRMYTEVQTEMPHILNSPYIKSLGIPGFALAMGLLMFCFGDAEKHASRKTIALVLMYFGSQACMNFIAKGILAKLPAPFLVTAFQQVGTFFMYLFFILLSRLRAEPYQPKVLRTRDEVAAVFLFGAAFAMNISLNNMSVALVPLQVNLVVRSCLPLSTYLSGLMIGTCVGADKVNSGSTAQLLLMICGVLCAAATVLSQMKGVEGIGGTDFIIGVFVGVVSIFTGAINLVIAGLLGTSVGMNPIDSTGYMSLPAFFLLCIPSAMVPHPVNTKEWPSGTFVGSSTDVTIFEAIYERDPKLFGWLFLFAPLCFLYNSLQWTVVQHLSANYTAFCGNFNKAAAIAISLVFGLDPMPKGFWGWVNVMAVAGNIAAFTAYSYFQEKAKQQAKQMAREKEALTSNAR